MSRQNEADIAADARVKAAIAHADAKAIKDAVVDAGQAQAN